MAPDPREPSDHSVYHEPHLRPRDAPPPRDPPSGEAAYDSVWGEPTTSSELTGRDADDESAYGQWLEQGRRETSFARSWAITFVLATVGGPFAVFGALWASGETALGILAMVVIAPVVEEMGKVAAPLITIERRPFLFRSPVQIVICGFAAGLAFAAIENLLYLNVYIREPSPAIIRWRWTVCVALHTGCSTVAALGVARMWRDAQRRLAPPRIEAALPLLIAAMVLHGGYNLFALLFELLTDPF
jgi:hypothetical protein